MPRINPRVDYTLHGLATNVVGCWPQLVGRLSNVMAILIHDAALLVLLTKDNHVDSSLLCSSGGENDGEDFSHNWGPPDHDLILKLVAQIEYYLSDENLEKDAFLLKHIRRNKMGFVSVKLLTSFKKVSRVSKQLQKFA